MSTRGRYVISIAVGIVILLGLAHYACQLFSEDRSSGLVVPERMEVKDYPAPDVVYPPHYWQDDAVWAGLEYAGGTVGDSGCGLLVYASTLTYITDNAQYTPAFLLEDRERYFIIRDGVNDMSMARGELESRGVLMSGMYWQREMALDSLARCDLVWASVTGSILGTHYDGHLVMLYNRCDGIGLYDPKRPEIQYMSMKEFESVSWVYFYTILV